MEITPPPTSSNRSAAANTDATQDGLGSQDQQTTLGRIFHTLLTRVMDQATENGNVGS